MASSTAVAAPKAAREEQKPTTKEAFAADSTCDRDAAAAAAARVLLERIGRGTSAALLEAVKAEVGAECTSKSPVRRSVSAGSCAGRRRVHFDLSASTAHEIPPYSEIYGLHPREFVFDRNFYAVPTAPGSLFVGLYSQGHESDDDEDSEVSDEDSDGSGLDEEWAVAGEPDASDGAVEGVEGEVPSCAEDAAPQVAGSPGVAGCPEAGGPEASA